MGTTKSETQAYSEAVEMLRHREQRVKLAFVCAVVGIGVLMLAAEVRLAGLVAVLLGAAAAMLWVRSSISASPVYVAEKFILTDHQRRVRGIVGMDEEYATLRFFTASGEVVLDLSASSDFSSILLRPGVGDEGAPLSYTNKFGPSLTLKASFGETMIGAFRIPGTPEELGSSWAPGPYFWMKDARGRKRASLTIVSGEHGSTDFRLEDGTGKAQVSFGAGASEGAFLEVKDPDGWRTLLGRNRFNVAARFAAFDKDGNVSWQAP
jgi:hypothetical protein